MGYAEEKCARCGGDESVQDAGLGYTQDYDTQLCRDCRVAWGELGLIDKRFIRYRELQNTMDAMEMATNVMERSDTNVRGIRKEYMDIRAEQEKIGKDIYYFAKLWANNDA